MKCIHCNGPKLYKLQNGHYKCAHCKRKFSPKKLVRQEAIMKCWCAQLSAQKCAQKLGLHYLTVYNQYQSIRTTIARFMEEEFENKKSVIAFEEYLFIENTKKGKKEYIFDAYNILTFNFDGKIYNILLPDLARFKPAFLDDGLEKVYYKEFEKFLRQSKIQSSYDPLIESFWQYLETFMRKYRGIKRKNFLFYLKEAEFRFNFDCDSLEKILR